MRSLFKHGTLADWIQIGLLIMGSITLYFRLEKRISLSEQRIEQAEAQNRDQASILNSILTRCCSE